MENELNETQTRINEMDQIIAREQNLAESTIKKLTLRNHVTTVIIGTWTVMFGLAIVTVVNLLDETLDK